MQNIENDMDELFRKAIDQAPLIPATSRWDEIAGKLSGKSANSVAGLKVNHFKKISGVFGYLLSAIIAVTILTTFITHDEINSKHDPAARTGNSMKEKNAIANKQIRNNSLTGNIIFTVKKQSTLITYLKNENKTNLSSHPFYASEGRQSEVLLISAKNGEYFTDPILFSDKSPSDIQYSDLNLSVSPGSRPNPFAYDNFLRNHKSVELTDSFKNSHHLTLVNLNSFTYPRFYLGLSGGPLMSQIKNQGFTKPGFDMGLLIGYIISNKLSIETGLLFTKQYYFVGGKYYNSVTGANTVNSMEGSRTSYEIPFKFNYYVLRNEKGGLFISTGVSSYVGVNDKIIINVGENPQHPPQKLDYGLASYLPSYLDFSLGYDYKSGKSTHFRIEPYLEIPMSSAAGNTININSGGALQVFNAGLHLVITEFIH
jgi:hypothetical protein